MRKHRYRPQLILIRGLSEVVDQCLDLRQGFGCLVEMGEEGGEGFQKVAGCWLLVTGSWLLVAGCWYLVFGC